MNIHSLAKQLLLLLSVFLFSIPLNILWAECLTDQITAPKTGTIVNINNENELQTAVSNLSDNTTLVLSPGTYNLTNTLYIKRNNITITGATTSCQDVILIGKGMDNSNYGNVPYGFWVNSHNFSLYNLTIRDVYYHTIIFNSGAQSPRVSNVKLINSGEQFIKSNPTGYGNGVDNGVVEFSIMEYPSGPPTTDHGGGTGYTNGVDVLGGKNWLIRNNVFRNFHTPDGADQLWNPAILVWKGAGGTVSENNIFINCDRAIAYGLINDSRGHNHSGGIIRNNMIVNSSGLFSTIRKYGSDAAIIVWDSPNTKVIHNTVLTNGNHNKAIEFRFDTQGAEAINNLIDAPIFGRNNAPYITSGNSNLAAPALFVNSDIGNLHLKSSTSTVIKQVNTHSLALQDVDGQPRPVGGLSEVGADELGLARPMPPSALAAAE